MIAPVTVPTAYRKVYFSTVGLFESIFYLTREKQRYSTKSLCC